MSTPPPAVLPPEPPPWPDDLVREAVAQGWPAVLVKRARTARISTRLVRAWLARRAPIEYIEREVARVERLTSGTLRSRIATLDDSERLVDLFADSPEDIGEWEVTVERGPNPFAQMRLQERGYMVLVEDRGYALAATQRSTRETFVGGVRMLVNYRSAQRVRRSARGLGYSRLVGVVPASEPWATGVYYHLRAENDQAVNWLRHLVPDAEGLKSDHPMPGVPTIVYRLPPLAVAPADGVRRATEADAEQCGALLRATHEGRDLYWPLTADALRVSLREHPYGYSEQDREHVYGWSDYYVVEDAGVIVACGGLWDRGRDIREVWRHRETGEVRVIDATGLMDFGYAPGREDAMARLIRYFQHRTAELGRGHLMAPLQHLPALSERIGADAIEAETRWLIWYRQDTPTEVLDTDVTSPHTDLRYW